MTIKIEAGKCYRTRDGRKVGPMYQDTTQPKSFGDWCAPSKPWMFFNPVWHIDGKYWPKKDFDHDLVAEWADDPKTPPILRDMTDAESCCDDPLSSARRYFRADRGISSRLHTRDPAMDQRPDGKD